jgi:hypothetical protein
VGFNKILDRFIQNSPIPTMARALLERTLTEEKLNGCFAKVAEKQYTRELLFSALFELMSLVVTKTFPSINAAYQTQKNNIGVSIASVYNKLNGLETNVSASVVRDTAQELATLIKDLDGTRTPLLDGYRVKMLDGNCLAASERRLEVLRDKSAGPLPGKSLVVYDPALEMAVDVVPCEDGHAQERSLLSAALSAFERNDVVIADRNFCVRSFLCSLVDQESYFICRYHKQMPYRALNESEKVGESETGDLYEQWIEVEHEHKGPFKWRKIDIKLKKPTRDGDKILVILTNLPASQVDAQRIAELYRKRWNIETAFQQLEAHLQSEIDTLAYPRAALFGFCVALVAYNVMAVVKAALRGLHGEEKIANEVSGYYIAGEIGRTQEGMRMAVLPEEWAVFQAMPYSKFLATLKQMAEHVKLEKYKKHRRGPKKALPKRISSSKEPHVSTAKLLAKNKKSP